MASIEFSIGNSKFVVKSDESEEHLREVAELVRRKVESLRKRANSSTLHKAAILAAFDFASTTIKTKRKSSEARAQLLTKTESILGKLQSELGDTPHRPS